MKVNKLWTIELSGSYTSSMTIAQFVTDPTWIARVGAQVKVLKDKGSLRIFVNDPLHAYRPGGDVNTIRNATVHYTSWLDTRGLSAIFTYRFSKGQNLKLRQTGSATDELKRVKTS
ncbi:MAG: outer membrane beta-barrel protein [Saprospiraceae bacterium]|nr:outer membrane beta-barrel protein [Saprospiraceae bacterium]